MCDTSVFFSFLLVCREQEKGLSLDARKSSCKTTTTVARVQSSPHVQTDHMIDGQRVVAFCMYRGSGGRCAAGMVFREDMPCLVLSVPTICTKKSRREYLCTLIGHHIIFLYFLSSNLFPFYIIHPRFLHFVRFSLFLRFVYIVISVLRTVDSIESVRYFISFSLRSSTVI